MKKLLVLAVLATLVATSALATIVNTKHDLSPSGGPNAELCVFCHTPHGADTSVADAPLWNRSTTDLSATSPYVGIDLENTLDASNYVNTDAVLCLSCHDGSLTEVLVNEPNAGATNASGYLWASNDANLDTDMSDDHPIGFSYTTVAQADGGNDVEIHSKATAEGVLGTGALSYGTGNDMWCSSCHDVHNNDNSPFLRLNNAGSNLCLACHNK